MDAKMGRFDINIDTPEFKPFRDSTGSREAAAMAGADKSDEQGSGVSELKEMVR